MTDQHQVSPKNERISAEEMILICQKYFGFNEREATKLVKYLNRWEDLPLEPLKDKSTKLSIREIMDIVVLTALTFKVLACYTIGLIKNKKREKEKSVIDKNNI